MYIIIEKVKKKMHLYSDGNALELPVSTIISK